jgi:hypothetical protein
MNEPPDDAFASDEDVLRALEERLAGLGAAPLDADIAERCRAQMRSARRRPRGLPMKLVPAAAVVVVLGSGVGLAAADTLPAPAQDVAHRALGAVGLHVPPGHERFNDPAECPDGPYRNHGAYVKAHKDDPDAGKSRCGKPTHAGVDDESSDTAPPGADKKQHGKNEHEAPEQAHGHGNKPKDHADKSGDEADDRDAPDAPGASEPEATTTTEPASTTSTAVATTTTTVADTTSTSEPSSGQP